MLSCHDMKKDEIYICEECGLELKVVKECEEAEASDEECCCASGESDCSFMCCGMNMVKK